MLDEDQRVPEIAELAERFEQPAVVPRVQADRRLVEDVQHAGERPADLPRETNALHFAAGERGQRPRQREVVQSHFDQERQPARPLVQQVAGDLAIAAIERHRFQERQRVRQRQLARLLNRLPLKPHRRGIVAEPAAAARGAGHLSHEVLQPLPIDV
ncbi:MAG: hypothetical protein WD069_08460 [Planctomycetales bacterium]